MSNLKQFQKKKENELLNTLADKGRTYEDAWIIIFLRTTMTELIDEVKKGINKLSNIEVEAIKGNTELKVDIQGKFTSEIIKYLEE